MDLPAAVRQAAAAPTPIGNLPADGALDTSGLEISQADLDVLLSVDPAAWQQEADLIGEHLATFGPRLPVQLWEEHDALLERLKAARERRERGREEARRP